MGAVVGTLVELGYGVAWRVLDAQHFGVPQRRRRVFIVAERAGDPAGAAQVLFERQSVRGDTSQGRAQGQETPRGAGTGAEEPTGFNYKAGIDIQDRIGFTPALKVSDGGGASVMVTGANGGKIMNCLSAELYHKSTVVNQDVNNGHLIITTFRASALTHPVIPPAL
jgi:site-specific DNA-cytosine methylase